MAESHGASPFSRDDKNKLKIKAFELKFTNYSDKMKHIFLGKNLQESSKGELGDGIWRDEHGKTHEVRKKALVDHIGGMLVDG
ncbi:MAG: hypothetical protein IKO41_12920 [Lachnospiraceae bacterium]|nr:hypothetical protein [Lachnospiraceae bacterium]MBR6150081.1 hypothetical protein [Lachnospiraceae bacterium]